MVLAIIMARVVFPHPGGPRKIIEGIFWFMRKAWSALFSPMRWGCPTKSARVFGLRIDESGSFMR